MNTFNSTDLSLSPHPFYVPVRVEDLNGLSINKNQDALQSSSTLIVVWGGNGYIDVNEDHYRIVSGNVLLCPGTSSLRLLPQHELHGVWIEYSNVMACEPNVSPLNSNTPLQNCEPQVLALAADLSKAWAVPGECSPFAVQHLFSELLAKLYSSTTDANQTPSGWLDHVLQYIDTHYYEDLTRGQMAEFSNVSPEHFSRTFRKTTGQTFTAYLTLLRVRKAQQRILTGTTNLTDLALEVGYTEGTYLSRKFKQIVGLSPTAYHGKSKKIVALNYNHTASLRALEITPQLGVYSEWLESIEAVPDTYKLRLESADTNSIYNSVASVRPDVIISYPLNDENKRLLPIAPLIELPFMQMNWREQFGLIAAVVDRQKQAAIWLRQYDELCYAANTQLNHNVGARGTAIVWEIASHSAYCFSSSYGRGCQILYSDLGFQPPTKLIEKGIIGSGYIETSIEDISSYPADHIIITGLPSDAEGINRTIHLFHSEQWLKLDAVRNKRVYILNQPEMFYGFDPMSSLAQLRVLLQALTS
jgi:ABC-type Fe3+-hydroxamate transport system substrate-binding protein